jgi:hypothetical protein
VAVGDDGAMGVIAELQGPNGKALRGLPDPAGGVFDAAGDFDRLVTAERRESLPVFGSIDLYGTTVLDRNLSTSLLDELPTLIADAAPGPECRGLQRLRVLAERCTDGSDLSLVFIGD